MTDARKQIDPSEFLVAFGDRLRACDIDVAGITTGVPIARKSQSQITARMVWPLPRVSCPSRTRPRDCRST